LPAALPAVPRCGGPILGTGRTRSPHTQKPPDTRGTSITLAQRPALPERGLAVKGRPWGFSGKCWHSVSAEAWKGFIRPVYVFPRSRAGGQVVAVYRRGVVEPFLSRAAAPHIQPFVIPSAVPAAVQERWLPTRSILVRPSRKRQVVSIRLTPAETAGPRARSDWPCAAGASSSGGRRAGATVFPSLSFRHVILLVVWSNGVGHCWRATRQGITRPRARQGRAAAVACEAGQPFCFPPLERPCHASKNAPRSADGRLHSRPPSSAGGLSDR